VHRVIRDVDDVIAPAGARSKHGSDPRHGFGAAVDDTVEIDEKQQTHEADRSRRFGPPLRAAVGAAYDRRLMPTSRDPLADTARLIVDGSNLLPALARGGGSVPPAALIGRMRAAIPASIAVELVFDGPPDPGLRGERIAAGVTVRHAGRRSADEAILELIERGGPTFATRDADAILVVTDDRELGSGVRARGARTAGTAWLIGRLQRPGLASSSVGNRRPPAAPQTERNDPDRTPWKPGRGATSKKGNPRRRRPPSGSMPS